MENYRQNAPVTSHFLVMINTPPHLTHLIEFLQNELLIPSESIQIAMRHEATPNLFSIVLWQYGLVSLEQLDKIFEWLETA